MNATLTQDEQWLRGHIRTYCVGLTIAELCDELQGERERGGETHRARWIAEYLEECIADENPPTMSRTVCMLADEIDEYLNFCKSTGLEVTGTKKKHGGRLIAITIEWIE